MGANAVAVTLVVFLLLSTVAIVPAARAETTQATLASHWVPGSGFRDELNASDIDYQNFWMDNAGKILTSAFITGDTVDANRALGFIQDRMTTSYYLPEVLVNSSMVRPQIGGDGTAVSNRIVTLAESGSSSELQRLSVGDYYAGPWTAGYLGSDRLWYNGSAHRAASAEVMALPDGLVKKSYFSFDGLSFYTYLNATVIAGDPFVRVSVQVQPLNSTFGAGDYAYLQVFAGATGNLQEYAFENATIFDVNGNLARLAPFDNATARGSGGMLITYSNRTSALAQNSVALRFNTTNVYDVEHWYMDRPYGGLSWVGLGYNLSAKSGQMSAPVYTDVYPIQHLDYRLLSDTAKYIISNPENVSVAPPVSFGFIARGLALESNLNPSNQTLRRLASGYWNFYYHGYTGTQPTTAYSRAINVFVIAGFELYGGNSTVESFTRYFGGDSPGSSIEEYGWAVAALQTLYLYSGSASDRALYEREVESFVPGGGHFLGLAGQGGRADWTFQFAEAASGLLSGKVPYNNSAVIWAMNAVFQSNQSGVLLNEPYHGDLANTETIPAYALATWAFRNAMRSGTAGYWIDWVHNVNITSIDYTDGKLDVQVVGQNGLVRLGTPNGIIVCSGINGNETLPCQSQSLAWVVPALEAVALVAGAMLLVVWILRRKKIRRH